MCKRISFCDITKLGSFACIFRLYDFGNVNMHVPHQNPILKKDPCKWTLKGYASAAFLWK